MQTLTDYLSKQIEKKKFANGYLFTGIDREKKKELAHNFAKALNCENGNHFETCSCVSCTKIESGNHPDIRWYGLDEDASSIKIESIRDLQNWLNLRPYEGRTKVFILNDADKLTTEAQNALLKSLEEPPVNSVLILLTQKKSDLLPTVTSRVVEIKVSSFSEKEIVLKLNQEGLDLQDAKFLARFSQGSLQYARKLKGAAWIQTKNDLMKSILNDRINGFEKLAQKPKKEALELLQILIAWTRDACLLRSGGDSSLLVHEDRAEALKTFIKKQSLESLLELNQLFEETRSAIEDNANVKLSVTRLQIHWKEFVEK